ncbi:hypothetical protein [Geopseudomonas aromaticivorans]
MKSRKPDPNYPLLQEVPGANGITLWSLGSKTLTITPETDPDKLKAAKLSAYSQTAWSMGYHALSYELAKHTPSFSMARATFDQEMSAKYGAEPSIPPSDQHPFHYPNRYLEEMAALVEKAAALGVESFTPERFMERINAGTNRGFTINDQRTREAECRQMADDLETGRITPRRVCGVGTTKVIARRWIAEQRTKTEMGLITDGALDSLNLSNLNTNLRIALREVEAGRTATLEIPAEEVGYPGPRP